MTGPPLKESQTFRSFCIVDFWDFWSWWSFLQSSYSATGTLNLQPKLLGFPGASQGMDLDSLSCVSPIIDLTEDFPASVLLWVTVASSIPAIQPTNSLFLPHLRVQQDASTCYLRRLCYHWGLQVDPPFSIPFSQPEMKRIGRSISEF